MNALPHACTSKTAMKISICIPNYNYAEYLGRTLESVLEQDVALEVVIADNASTDASVEVIRAMADERIKLRINRCNVGFAGNLDKAASMARGEWMLMLSSDDLIRPGALGSYARVFDAVGGRCAVSSSMDVIDPDDVTTGRIGPPPPLWLETDRDPTLDALAGGPVYRVAADELLRRALLEMKNPFNFAATAYPRAAYEAVEGYGGGRLINPDKWFHWKLLGAVDQAIFIDRPHFAYRWHPRNQTAQQAATGALKYLVDQYTSTLEIEGTTLDRIGLTRDDVIDAFVEHDIARHGLATLARGNAPKARRVLAFGRSVYPTQTQRNPRAMALAALLRTGPLAPRLAKVGYDWVRR